MSQAWQAFRAQARVELLLSARRFESLLVVILVPLVLLVFLSAVQVFPAGTTTINRLVPAILAVAIISTGQVSLGTSTAFERDAGVLKRLAGSPLPRPAYLGAEALAIVVTELAQVVLIAILGTILGWSPPGGMIVATIGALPWLALGSVAFCAFGLLLAGTLRAEAVLALANGLFVLFILMGGVILPLDAMPTVVAVPVSLLPPALLTELLRGALEPGGVVAPLQAAGLAAWAVALGGVAIRSFRTD